MQTSYTPNDWNEDNFESRLRDELNKASAPELVRKLYPLRARLIGTDTSYGYQQGHVFQYARTKDKLSLYPIEVCVFGEPLGSGRGYSNGTMMQHYNSAEAELLEP